MMRWVASLLGVVISLVCIAAAGVMNFKYGMSLGREWDEQLVFSVVAACFDGLKVLTPFYLWWSLCNRRYANAFVSAIALIGFIAWSMVGILGFVELNRASTTGAVLSKQESAQGLQSDLARKSAQLTDLGVVRPVGVIDDELSGLRQDKRWTSTQQCTAATATASRDFCVSYSARQAEREKAVAAATLEKEITGLREGVKGLAHVAQIDRGDPRAGIVARVTGWELPKVQNWLSLVYVVLLEMVATFGIFMSLNHGALQRVVAKKTIGGASVAEPPPMRGDASGVTSIAVTPLLEREPSRVGSKPQRRKPLQLIDGNKTTGDVAKFAVARLSPAKGSEVSLTELFESYQSWCAREGFDAVSVERFRHLFRGLCELSGFTYAERGDDIYCVNLKLAA